MKGITLPELLEYSIRLLDLTLDGGLEREISDWEPEASRVPDANLDSRLMEGITNLEHSASGVSLDSGPMEGMLCPEPSPSQAGDKSGSGQYPGWSTQGRDVTYRQTRAVSAQSRVNRPTRNGGYVSAPSQTDRL